MPSASAARLVKRGSHIKCALPHERRHGLGKVTVPCGHTLVMENLGENNFAGEVVCRHCGGKHDLLQLLAVALDGNVRRAESASLQLQKLVWLTRLERVARQLHPNLDEYDWTDKPTPPEWVADNLFRMMKLGFLPLIPDGHWQFVGISKVFMRFDDIPTHLACVAELLHVKSDRLTLPLSVHEVRKISKCRSSVLSGSELDDCRTVSSLRLWVGHLTNLSFKRYVVKDGEIAPEGVTDDTEAHCLVIVNKPS